MKPGQVVLITGASGGIGAACAQEFRRRGAILSLTARSEDKLKEVAGADALVTAADQLFQPLNPLLGPAPAQPPANVAILPLATFAEKIAPLLPAISTAAGASAVPGSQAGTQWQVQAQVDPAALRGSPAHGSHVGSLRSDSA